MPGFEVFGDHERAQVNEVLETGVLMRYGFEGMRQGRFKALEFEKSFAQKMGVAHCQLVSSGTSALSVALAVAGVGAGDEVIVPTFTFVASFESILMLGAIPVLVDIDATLTLDPKAVSDAITPKTKCVMPVHMCGSMADLDALKAICDAHDLILLEDACQAIGGTYRGKALGSYGDLGCFSFDFVKTITCGEGGAVITNNKTFALHADQFQDHGHDHVGSDRGAETHPYLGYNFRISELNAAVGCAQLERMNDILAQQQKHYQFLRAAIKDIEGVTFRHVPEGGVENYSFLNIFLPTVALAEQVHAAMTQSGIDACFYWFKNNWHYISGWPHLTQAKSLYPMMPIVQERLNKLATQDFSRSDHYMGRNVSFLIKLGWDEETLKHRAALMTRVLEQILSN
ncbi:MAG: DegT/DnrJ/EryC1/StrS family aminotransferase [Flavobacteriaceae bacterium]|nr:DegT/DnrJ/EryC1/StrS family aminotransferase [Flavobacteriaceae bacterium]MDG1961754.1 DegT/DnrJ/EryC1/StrS family aminotransferase [Flavobacteriaceae bacterium]